MVNPIRKKGATLADIAALPENLVGEILAGELVVSPRPAVWHAVASSSLGMKLGPPFHHGDHGPGGWWLLDEPELHLGSDVLVPDLAGWRRERLPALPDSPAFDLAPDWVCEVVSPSTSAIDRAVKSKIYARERVRHLWLLDPRARTLEVMRLEEGRWVVVAVHAGDEVVRAEPFEAIELELAALWTEGTRR
ncbi:MAG TPA: hypothetical protein DFS52_05650 [Myxococcales bacterium]|nr:hypothetical protein [Myxococcales bacterium]